MDTPQTKAIDSHSVPPVTEADLHAYVDRQLASARHAQVEQYLAEHPEEQARVQAWQQQNARLREMLAPVMDEPLPLGLPLRPAAAGFPWRSLAAAVLIAVVSAGSAWSIRGAVDAQAARLAAAQRSQTVATSHGALAGFAQRAAIAHVVYSPDVRRPVEIGADQEQALVTWLTKRMGTEVRPPQLAGLGYELIGGRLLPGGDGPVAQFMYGTAGGQRLTLYVTREVPGQGDAQFKFGQDGPVNVFYWVEDHLGYAISAGADKAELMRVSQEVYRQLKHG
ncbi:anti-sigma factor RsiW [Comamonas odontotermitis]|uniref:Anti-sigma factor RsiW n=1 Tax=Comamonas odontotermitis TaxID=379895 RepID=A0ABR6RJ20_9BURK|nr:anti-sigma factor [Comamonas odontotermitis]MBB6579173.1 anti-sigma factor RsiW [Comamonas odontotermitis]